MFDDTYTPKIFQVRELNSSLFSPSQFVKATGRAYILDNVQSLIQTSRPLTIDHCSEPRLRLGLELALFVKIETGPTDDVRCAINQVQT